MKEKKKFKISEIRKKRRNIAEMNFCEGICIRPTAMLLLPLLFAMCIIIDNHQPSPSFLFGRVVTATAENNNNYQQWGSRKQHYNNNIQKSMFETATSSEEKEEEETTKSPLSFKNKEDEDDDFWQDGDTEEDDDDDFFDSIRPLLPKKEDVQKQIHTHIIKPILSSFSSTMEGEEEKDGPNIDLSSPSKKEGEDDEFWQDDDDDFFNKEKPFQLKKKRRYIKHRFVKPLLSSLSTSNGRTTTSISLGITIRNHKRGKNDKSDHEQNSNTDCANSEENADDDLKVENDSYESATMEEDKEEVKKKNKWSIQITGEKTEETNSHQKRRRRRGSILADDEYDLNEEEFAEDDEYDEMDDLTPLLTAFLKKRGEDLFHAVASKVCSEETHQALKTIQKILSQFSDHGVVDVFSLYPAKDIILSTLALSRLQHCYLYTNEQYTTAEKDASEGSFFSSLSSWIDDSDDGTDDEIVGDNHFKIGSDDGSLPHSTIIDKNLLSDLAHYAVFANAAYGWKGGAFTGQVHIGDLNVLLKTTGIDKNDVVATQWHSKTHRPAFFLVRDLQRNKLVLSIRGTLSARDILTDLCCTADDFRNDDNDDDGLKSNDTGNVNGSAEALLNGATEVFHNTFRPKNRAARAHHGMLESAKGLAKMTRKMIASELAANPKLSLVIVGHSLGGGVAAVLGAMWEDTFPGLAVYAYGCPCVGPLNASPTINNAIISIVGEGDPFSCLSLGHLADISSAISQLCRHHELRDEVLRRTRGKVENMNEEDLFYCYDLMEALRKHMNGEKFFPPGRILHMGGSLFGDARKLTLKEVSTDFFRDLKLHPRMLDLSRHAPIRYETALRRLWIETVRNE